MLTTFHCFILFVRLVQIIINDVAGRKEPENKADVVGDACPGSVYLMQVNGMLFAYA